MRKWTWAVVPPLVIIDQLTKRWIISKYDYREGEVIWGEFLRITRVHNPGAAFGIFQAYPEAFTWLTAFAIAMLVWHKATTINTSSLYHLGLAMVLSGAFGNIIDRFEYNYVVDFIDVGIGEWRWPAFNVADSSITVGVVMLLFAGGYEDKPAPVPVPAPQETE